MVTTVDTWDLPEPEGGIQQRYRPRGGVETDPASGVSRASDHGDVFPRVWVWSTSEGTDLDRQRLEQLHVDTLYGVRAISFTPPGESAVAVFIQPGSVEVEQEGADVYGLQAVLVEDR